MLFRSLEEMETDEPSDRARKEQILAELFPMAEKLQQLRKEMCIRDSGWATYNGDHMSMYAVNASVPKTLVRHLVQYYADTCGEKALSDIRCV